VSSCGAPEECTPEKALCLTTAPYTPADGPAVSA
jgi:hypothetical protein